MTPEERNQKNRDRMKDYWDKVKSGEIVRPPSKQRVKKEGVKRVLRTAKKKPKKVAKKAVSKTHLYNKDKIDKIPEKVAVEPPPITQPVKPPLSLAEKKKILIRLQELQKMKERLVAMRDFEYFLDKFVFIEDKEANRAIKLELWPAQREILPKLVSSNLLELLKTRQVGLTWLCAALVLWLAMKHELHLSIIISASEDHAKEFLDRVYFILDRLPDWFIPPVTTRTVLTLEFTRNKMKSTIKSMPTIEMGAESKTPNLLILDESHMVRTISAIFNSSYPGIEQAKGRVIIIANSVKTGPGWPWIRDNYVKSMRGEGLFERIFLPWTAHPGRPPDFRERMIASGMSPDDVVEHYPLTEQEALQSAMGSFFGNSLERHNSFREGEEGFLLRSDSGEIKWIQERHGSMVVWEHPDTSYKGRYAIGADVGEGLGGDFSVVYVLCRLTDSLVARFRSNRVDADTFGYNLRDISEYYGNATVCCERNGSGITTIKRLEELYVPQYVRILPGKTGGVVQKTFGWNQSPASKYELMGDLKTWFFNTESEIPCGVLLDEASTFIRTGQQLGAEDGKHDDTIVAAALSLQADKFMQDIKSSPMPERLPPVNTLAYIAHMDRQEALKDAMAETSEDWEW